MEGMVTRPRSDPVLTSAVERARELAEASGELQARPWPAALTALSPEAAEIVVSWVRDGGYARAVADLATTDTDLADQ